MILAAIRNNPGFSREKIANEVGKSRSTVTRAISELTKKNIIRRVGSDKTGRWIMVENTPKNEKE
ncbi:winged helix-turn-helix transcriptional regulator [Pectinatus frisingensis]|uniref:winged helix-turn-helix transcriptional regulator n=1 Tax=Pectinatus frisingensis TaxID=865 RepID=UPI0018C4E2E2